MKSLQTFRSVRAFHLIPRPKCLCSYIRVFPCDSVAEFSLLLFPCVSVWFRGQCSVLGLGRAFRVIPCPIRLVLSVFIRAYLWLNRF